MTESSTGRSGVRILLRDSGQLFGRITRKSPACHASDHSTLTSTHSDNGDAWSHFTYDMARSRAFRWGEDGIAGVSDTHGRMNIAFAFWNEKE